MPHGAWEPSEAAIAQYNMRPGKKQEAMGSQSVPRSGAGSPVEGRAFTVHLIVRPGSNGPPHGPANT